LIEHARHEPPFLTQPLLSAARRIIPWLILTALLVWMGSIYGRYRVSMSEWEATQIDPAAATRAAQAARAKTPPAKKPAAVKPSLVVVVSDVTFRANPDFSADVIRDLKTGNKLTLVSKTGEWYKVKDAAGRVGFVTAATKYTKLVAGK
jgi:hypothetical protein